jgi:hypothetical protein
MLRVMLILGVLVLVPAMIMFWRTRDRSAVDSLSSGGGKTVSSRPVGTSTLSHGESSPVGRPTGPGREVNHPASNLDPKR